MRGCGPGTNRHWALLLLGALALACGGSQTQGPPLEAVVWSGDTWVVAGEGDRLWTSPQPEALSSTRPISPPTGNLYGLARVGSTTVSVGDAGAVLVSNDAIAWAVVTLPGEPTLRGVAGGGPGGWVTVGGGGALFSSPDAQVWTPRQTSTSADLNAVTYGAGLWVAVGAGGIVLTSADAVNWTAVASATISSLNGVAFGGTTFVAVGDEGVVVISRDGVHWAWLEILDVPNMEAVTYGGGIFVIVGQVGSAYAWSPGTVPVQTNSTVAEDLYGAAYGNGLFFAVGHKGRMILSQDGVSWYSRRI